MTGLTETLDCDLVAGNSLRLFRLTTRKYAELNGKGAALSPGRWNKPGEEAIYTSLEAGTAVLERLAHTPKSNIPLNLALMRINLKGTWRKLPGRISLWSDVSSRSYRFAFASLEEANAASSDPSHPSFACFAVAVPSVIVPAWNVVLYPKREGFWEHVSLEPVQPFDYDPRLFPDDAERQPGS